MESRRPDDAERGRFRDVRHVASTGSTNADVLALGREGAPEGIVLIAGEQTAGRGRHGRTWVAAPGSSLLMSLLVRPPSKVVPLITATLALAARQALAETFGVTVGLKWPNDLVVATGEGREGKLAGILAEADWPAGSEAASGYRAPAPDVPILVVAGIGLNVHDQPDAPPEVRDRAVALDTLVDAVPSLDVLADAVIDRFDRYYDDLRRDPGVILDRWRTSCVTLGSPVRVDLGVDDVEGRAVAIDDEGRLVVETLTGDTRVFSAGDVTHLRGGIGPG